MKDDLKERISKIVDGKLSNKELEELVDFLGQTMLNSLRGDDEHFFKNLTGEMTGQVKDLAFLIIDFKRELKSKIHPGLSDIATKYIPQATDQLESIIKTTEIAANKIMDNLESMREDIEKMEGILAALGEGKMIVPGGKKEIDRQTIEDLSPLIDYIGSNIKNHMSLISDSFIQMSFQDLTGQRIKRIIELEGQIEERIKNMVISFGIKLTEKEKNPDISEEELQKVVKEKATELAGPQKEGQGLDQEGIDDLLANL
jgi:chemotaxis protein CheZ